MTGPDDSDSEVICFNALPVKAHSPDKTEVKIEEKAGDMVNTTQLFDALVDHTKQRDSPGVVQEETTPSINRPIEGTPPSTAKQKDSQEAVQNEDRQSNKMPSVISQYVSIQITYHIINFATVKENTHLRYKRKKATMKATTLKMSASSLERKLEVCVQKECRIPSVKLSLKRKKISAPLRSTEFAAKRVRIGFL